MSPHGVLVVDDDPDLAEGLEIVVIKGEVKVLMMTAYVALGSRETALGAGALGCCISL